MVQLPNIPPKYVQITFVCIESTNEMLYVAYSFTKKMNHDVSECHTHKANSKVKTYYDKSLNSVGIRSSLAIPHLYRILCKGADSAQNSVYAESPNSVGHNMVKCDYRPEMITLCTNTDA